MSSVTWRSVLLHLVAFLLCAPLCSLNAQELSLGDRVRVQSTETYPSDGTMRKSTYTTTGALSAWANDTLRIDTDSQARVSIFVSDVDNLEVSRGRTHQAPKGMAIGAGMGFLFGFFFGFTVDSGFGGSKDRAAGAGLQTGAVGAGVGLVIGALIGGLNSTDKWEDLPVGDLRVAVSPGALAFKFPM